MEADVLTRFWLLLIITLVPAQAQAQAQPTWDIAGTAGLFSGFTPRTSGTGFQESWFESVQGGVTVGRYLTPQVKVELDASVTGSGTQFRERLVTVPGYPFPYPAGSEVTTSVRSVAAAAIWQFRDNEWVHPFVLAGISTDFDRITVRWWEQFHYGNPGTGQPPYRVAEERTQGPDTTVAARALLGGGAKIYVTERAFVRTEARWTFDRDRHNLAFRAGFGVDF
jgi:hypothetical protein